MNNINNIRKIEGRLNRNYPQTKVAIVAARFNGAIVENMLKGALDIFARSGIELKNIDLIQVPGAFEIPLAALQAAKTRKYQGIVTLGAVIRGATAHFEYVASGATNGIMSAMQQTGVPITFGVLTTETLEQAIERAGSTVGNKGAEAAMALLEMIDVLEQIHE